MMETTENITVVSTNNNVRFSKIAFFLVILIAILAIFSSSMGLLSSTEGESHTFNTIRNETVKIYGKGIYKYDSVFLASAFQGQDTVILFLGVPLLVISLFSYRKESLRWSLFLSGILAFFLYVYINTAFGAAYNQLFLIYVSLFSLCFFAFILIFSSIKLENLHKNEISNFPRVGPAIFMFISGFVTLFVWLEPLIKSMTENTPPELLDAYTTMVTDALDLGIITPLTVISGVLILRKKPLGYKIAFPLLGIILLLLPTITLTTLFQLYNGVTFTTAEIIGPISGFSILGALSLIIMIVLLRKIPS
ncbi:MAG: hypothetical protein R6U52_01700 [Kosmotogaceae bacterium]